MKLSKTTAIGIITAVFGFIVFSPEDFKSMPLLVHLAKYFAAGGLASLGIVAADQTKEKK